MLRRVAITFLHPWRTGSVLCLVAVLLAAGCADDSGQAGDASVGPGSDATGDVGQEDAPPVPGDGVGETTPEATPPSLSLDVVTFNAGLARNFVPYADERLPWVVDALANLDADVVCLQEVWTPDQIDAIVAGVTDAFPHEYHVVTEDPGTGEPACTPQEADPMLTCVQDHCADDPDLTGCALSNCGEEFAALSQSCTGCLAANIDKPLDEIATLCTESSALYAWNGHNGLLLLSRLALEETTSTVLDSTLVQRAVLHARVLGAVDVFCTHLAANLDEPPYAGPYGSYAGEQAHQIDQLAAWIDEQAGQAPAVLLGDLNTGPDLPPDIVGELPDNWALLAGWGWQAPYVEQDAPACTFCADNPLVGEGSSHIIDHVLLRTGTVDLVERVLDEPITLQTDAGPVDSRLSDHYAVRVRFSWMP